MYFHLEAGALWFDRKGIQHEWKTDYKPMKGIKNLGNTCFMGSSLVTLSSLAPLANWILDDPHSCNPKGEL